MMRKRYLPNLCFPAALSAVAFCLLAFQAARGDEPVPGSPSPKIVEYVKRLEKTSPRDAEGLYQLGRWCAGEGLAEKATRLYERAIRVDPDHPGAREALGYRLQGLGWTRSPPTGAGTDPSTSGSPVASIPAGGPEKSAEKIAPPAAPEAAPAKAETKPKPDADEAKAEATARIDEAVAAKKRWAQEAAVKLETKFALIEDEDFLIHTTYEAGSPRVKALQNTLKNLKKLVQSAVGRSRTPIWPGKLHFIYMRASTECMRFAEAIDGMRFPEEDGYYTQGDAQKGYHTVLSAIPERGLATLLGHTALERLGNSNRFVGRWLRDGVGSLVAALTEEGKSDRLVEQAFHRAALEIEANPQGVTVFKLLETQDVRPNAAELFEVQAFTLVLYLQNLGGSRLQKLIDELKSPEAPAPPTGEDKLFASKYTAFQERAITTIFRDKLEKLSDKWKAYVTQKAGEIDKTTKPEPKNQKAKTGKSQKQGGGKDKGSKGGSRSKDAEGGQDRDRGSDKKTG